MRETSNTPPGGGYPGTYKGTFNDTAEGVEDYLKAHGCEIGGRKDKGGTTVWELNPCPCDRATEDGGCFVQRFPSGRLAAGCHHNHCAIGQAGRGETGTQSGWHTLRAHIDPGYDPKRKHRGTSGDGTAGPPPEPLAAVPLFGFEKPPLLVQLILGFIYRGFVSVLAADGGTGKSYLAIYLALMVALGRPFFGLPVRRGRVLYVDYELDEHEQKRRVWRVLAGLGLTPDAPDLQDRFYYVRPRYPLASDAGHDEVVAIINDLGIDLVILDSLTIGMGADATSQQDVTRIMQRFKEWGTVLAIDHISGLSARGNQSKARPFGSVFKRNVARSTFTLAKADGGALMMSADKNNFGPQQDLLCYVAEFEDGGEVVRFRRLDHTDEAMAGGMQHMSTYDITLLAIKALYGQTGGGVTADDVVVWRSDHDDAGAVKAGTVRNHFTVLKKRGQIELRGDGAALPIQPKGAHGAVHDTIHDVPAEHAHIVPLHPQNGHSRFTPPIDTVNRESAATSTRSLWAAAQRVETPKGAGTVEEGPDAVTGRVPVRLDHNDDVRYFDADQLQAPF